jgi:hypothetical protein
MRSLRNPGFGLIAGTVIATALCGGCDRSGASTSDGSDTGSQTGTPSPGDAATPAADDELRALLDETIDFTGRRQLSTADNAAWQVVHGILAYGGDLKLVHRGQAYSALDYLLNGGSLNGWRLTPGEKGLDCVLEAGSKTGMGHEDQWLGYMSFQGLSPDQKIVVPVDGGQREFTLMDLVAEAQWDIYDGQECTWTLMGLSSYLPLDSEWQASDGTPWTIERIVDFEASQDLNDSACGGSHRLCALTVALNRYQQETGKKDAELSGSWLKARQKIDESLATIRSWQQPDGSFSTEYFIRPATSPDAGDRLSTTGHQLEFLTLALSPEELREPWVVRAVQHLCLVFDLTRDLALECGGLYHSARALQNYRYVVFGPRETPAPASDPPPAPPTEDDATSEAPHS